MCMLHKESVHNRKHVITSANNCHYTTVSTASRISISPRNNHICTMMRGWIKGPATVSIYHTS